MDPLRPTIYPTTPKGWVQRLAEVEYAGNLELIRRTFDTFLEQYPLCFGYWLKYVRLVTQFSEDQDRGSLVVQVFERSVIAAPYCKELWIAYLDQLNETHAPTEQLDSVYSRALDAVGKLPDAHDLWTKYVTHVCQNPQADLVELYRTILSKPLFRLEIFWSQFIGSVLGVLQKSVAEKVREEMMQIFKKSQMILSRRFLYEQAISTEGGGRPFYHFEPLDEKQKQSWRDYIEFMLHDEYSTNDDVELLFERCLIACANYSEFWLKYTSWLEQLENGFEKAREKYEKANNVFLRSRTSISIEYAEFLEQYGKIDEARQVYNTLMTSRAPKWVKGILSYAHFERRNTSTEAAAAIIRKELDGCSDSVLPFLSMQLAVLEKDAACLANAVQKKACCAGNINLWLTWINVVHQNSQDASPIFEKALTCKYLSPVDKESMWQRYVDYLLENDMGIAKLRLARQKKFSSSLGKRKRENDENPLK